VSVPVVRAAVLSAYNLAGSARWKHCEYRKPSANRGQKCSDGSRCWARITTLYAAREPHISG
jgi:hypothetical protein